MSRNWDYNPDTYVPYEPKFAEKPADGSTVLMRIEDVEEKQSSNGNDMLVLYMTVLPNQVGADYDIREYIVDNEWANNKIGSIQASVELDGERKRVDPLTYFKGKVVAGRIKYEPYEKVVEGERKTFQSVKVSYYVKRGSPGFPIINAEPVAERQDEDSVPF